MSQNEINLERIKKAKPGEVLILDERPRCPKCQSLKISAFITNEKQGFKCLKCDHQWGVLTLRDEFGC